MIKTIFLLAFYTIASMGLFAASEQTPNPIPVSANTAQQNLPLALYKSLHTKLISMATLADPLLAPAVPAAGQSDSAEAKIAADVQANAQGAELQAQLRMEVQAHESEIVGALGSSQALQRELAARVLQYAADRRSAVLQLFAALSDADPAVRAAAATTLGKLEDARAVDPLLSSLHDSDEEVRSRAAAALGLLNDNRAIPGLLEVLRDDNKVPPRLQAAVAIGRIKSGVTDSDLAELLRQESDERVKMVLAAVIRHLSGEEAAIVPDIPDPNDVKQQLTHLSEDMNDVEHKLREDRYDQVVQLQEKDIDGGLSDLIRKLQQSQQSNAMQQQQQQKQNAAERLKQRMNGQQAQAMQRPSKPGSRQSSSLSDGSAVVAPNVVGTHEAWAALPDKDRDELLQVYRPEVPVRWRKRLEAYFISIAAEDAKREEHLKPAEKPK